LFKIIKENIMGMGWFLVLGVAAAALGAFALADSHSSDGPY
jgi:hypothetical protein